MSPQLLSLAAGVLPGLEPDAIVAAAADAGFAGVGIWYDHDRWTETTTARVSSVLATSGLVALDMEPVFVTPDGDHGDHMIDAAAELGVRNLLAVSRGVEPGPFAERMAELCQRAQPAGINVCLEFSRLFTIADLPSALDVVDATGEPNAAVLVDNLHLARCGHSPGDLASIPATRLPYAQLCDAPATIETADPHALYDEAVNGRCNLGDGELPVLDVVAALPPGTPLSLEIRSRALRDRWPDPTARARSVLDAAGAMGLG